MSVSRGGRLKHLEYEYTRLEVGMVGEGEYLRTACFTNLKKRVVSYIPRIDDSQQTTSKLISKTSRNLISARN